jgi:putative (di)nucleoside polyphosphate hydrolase
MSKSKSPSDLPYRPCVGAMIFNREGPHFRRQTRRSDAGGMADAQGGIDKGETPQQALHRELKEEIGTDHVEILREHPDWLTYDLPEHF